MVALEESGEAAPRGTVVKGHLRADPDLEELRRYLQDFVRYVPTSIYFNEQKVSQSRFSDLEDRENLTEIRAGTQAWKDGDLTIRGRLYEDRGHTLVASIEGLKIESDPINLVGQLRFENGPIDVFKRGFKLCATQVGCTIGLTGRLDCDRFVPTAGRDSLDAETTSLLGRIVLALEKIAVEAVLETPERIAQHTRLFRYIVRSGVIGKLGNVRVQLADGSESTLGDIRRRSAEGVGIYFGTTQKQTLNQIMQARGHLVVLLSGDIHRRRAEQAYLERYCSAKAFDGMIDCAERYETLSRFEKIFLSELARISHSE